METGNKLLYFALATIIFCIGTYLLLYSNKQFDIVLDNNRNKLKEKEEMYQQYITVDKEIVSSAELITTLFNPLEYDIDIDWINITKRSHNRELIGTYGIRNINYKKTYSYGESGNILKIRYTGLEEEEEWIQ